MLNNSQNKKVGYWYSLQESNLPKPIISKNKNEYSLEFINKCLLWINLNKTIKKNESELFTTFCNINDERYKIYMGSSKCRICNIINGDSEYNYNGYVFPEGIFHYIIEHNVIIDKDFQNMILKSSLLDHTKLKIETQYDRYLKLMSGMTALKYE